MRESRSSSSLLALLALVWSACAFGSDAIPAFPERRIFDGAGLLSLEERAPIERWLTERASLGTPVYVATLDRLGDFDLSAHSRAIATGWSEQGGDSRLLLLAVYREERRIAIVAAPGTERPIADGDVARIVEEQIAPHFERGAYAAGIERGIATIAARHDGEAFPEPMPSRRLVLFLTMLLVLGALAVPTMLLAYHDRRGIALEAEMRRYPGGWTGRDPSVGKPGSAPLTRLPPRFRGGGATGGW